MWKPAFIITLFMSVLVMSSCPVQLPCFSASPPSPEWNCAQNHVTWPFGSKTRRSSTGDAKTGLLTKFQTSFFYLKFQQHLPQWSAVLLSSNLDLEISSKYSFKISYYFLVSLTRTRRYLFEFTTLAVQCIIIAQRSLLQWSFRRWEIPPVPGFQFETFSSTIESHVLKP